jgi:hypothetical protein
MGVLQGEQELIFHKPIPPKGTLITTGKIVDIFDKGKDKGALVVAHSDTVCGNGQKRFTNILTIFGRLDGGFGGQNRKKTAVEFPVRKPDFVVQARPSPDSRCFTDCREISSTFTWIRNSPLCADSKGLSCTACIPVALLAGP